MKIYNLSYQQIGGGFMDKQTNDLFDLSLAIDKALEDKYVLRHTIIIETKEVAVRGLKQPPLPTPLSDDDKKREIEYQNFKKGR